ncbi:MAG: TM2 domain-containing protein [Myxococcota bacterium]|nr:TM2 domain-containing protein [Myxococcota bacterium]
MSTALVPKKNSTIAYLMWLAGFVGISGLHRIYMGRWISGLLWLFTGGFCMVGNLIDGVMMPKMLEASEEGKGW